MDLDLTVDASVSIIETGSHPSIDELKVNLEFIPVGTIQQEISFLQPTAIPSATITTNEKKVIYEWDNPKGQTISFGYTSLVKTKNEFPDLYSKISYPITNMPSEAISYIKPTEKIVVTTDISTKAQEIVGNEHDLYKVVFKLADWTKENIKYDINTLTQDAVQDSQWVLENKNGVCDELTNLFISFLRSQGIPARFISGMVYSNINNNWGPHGWAEVYYPGYGWIPYDITFGQYGWLDPTHIKLKESKDSNEPAANYNWISRDIMIKPNEIVINVELNEKGSILQPQIELEIEPLKREVSFNSYVPLRVHVKNTQNHYVSDIIFLKKAPGVEGSNTKYVALAPKEEKDIYWIIKTPEGKPNYIYTSTIEAKTAFESSATTKLKYFSNGEEVTLEKAEEKIKNLEETGPVSMSYLEFECKSDKQEYFSYEPAIFSCTLKNTGGKTLENLDVCLFDDCKTIDLSVDEMGHVIFSLDNFEDNLDIYFIAKNVNIAKYAYPLFTLLKTPKIELTDVDYPNKIRYDEIDNLTFIFATDSKISDVTIQIENLGKVNIAEFVGRQKLTIPFEAYVFYKTNLINIKITYYDLHNKEYTKEISFPITIENIGFFSKLSFWLRRVF